VQGDQSVISQVISNLLRNALCSIAHKKTGAISIAIEEQDSLVTLEVKDNGRGIKKEDLPYIFEAFFSRNTKGSGLGLAFCRFAMERMGGSICASSVEEEYAQFSITLKKPQLTSEAAQNDLPNSMSLSHHNSLSR
jgi:signal transduction histidine kinase